MIKIVLTRSMVSGDIQHIKEGLDKEVANKYEFIVPEEFTEECIAKEAVSADILLGPYITPAILEKAERLKLIQVPWTGMDTFNFKAMSGHNVVVCNTHSNANAVAELAVALLLDLLKKTAYHDRKMRKGSWNREQNPLSLKSKMVYGQTVCLLGFGNIGQKIGQILYAFGAKIIAVDDKNIESSFAEIFPSIAINSAVASAGVVICALPLTENTKGMIDGKLFSYMQNDAVLINISRAEIINEDDLYEAIVSGKIGAFGADVWWNAPARGKSEAYPSLKHDFCIFDNVILSPHRAGFVDGPPPHLKGAIDNIVSFIQGRPLKGIVDLEKGY